MCQYFFPNILNNCIELPVTDGSFGILSSQLPAKTTIEEDTLTLSSQQNIIWHTSERVNRWQVIKINRFPGRLYVFVCPA